LVGTHADSAEDRSSLGDEILQAVNKADANQREEIQAEIDMLRSEYESFLTSEIMAHLISGITVNFCGSNKIISIPTLVKF